MVQRLLQHGARWDETDGFGGDALGRCLHAAIKQPEPGGDYAALLAVVPPAARPATRG